MNKMGLLMMDRPIVNATNPFATIRSKQNLIDRSNFHNVLSNLSNQTIRSKKGNSVITKEMIGHLKKVLNKMNSPSREVISVIEDLKTKLSQILETDGIDEIDESLLHQLFIAIIQNEPFILDEDLPEGNLVQLLIDKLKASIEKGHEENQITNSSDWLFLITEPLVNEQSENMNSQLQQLLQGITEILSNLTGDDKSMLETSSRILALLEQWSKLSRDARLSLNGSLQETLSNEELKLWEKLTDIFSKRLLQQRNGNYQSEATVTKRDVSNWLHQLIPNILDDSVNLDNSVGRTILTTSSQDIPLRPMTQVEQFVVHLQQTDRVERVSNELMQKMIQIVQQSQFARSGNQMQQLSLTIRPENLGNMTLHFTQMNGDMVVKIIVSSQMAKEMLETNIHQLKHLFAPHQVMIERDSTISDEQFFNQDYEEGQFDHDESMEETNDEQESNKDHDDNQIDFESLLQMAEGGG